MMQTDVKSAYSTASASLYTQRARIKGIHISVNTAGTSPVTLYDTAGNSAAGNVLAQFGVNSVGNVYLLFPGEGILATNGIYLSLGSAYSATVFYG